MLPHNLGTLVSACKNKTARACCEMGSSALSDRMQVAHNIGKRLRLANGTRLDILRRQGEHTIPLLKARGAAARERQRVRAELEQTLASKRVRTVSALLPMGLVGLKEQLQAFKVLDAKKGAVKAAKAPLLAKLVEWLVEKYGAAANDCTPDQIRAAAAEKAARGPRGEGSAPSGKRKRGAELYSIDGILDAKFCLEMMARLYLLEWTRDASGRAHPASWETYASLAPDGTDPSPEVAELVGEVDRVSDDEADAQLEHDARVNALLADSPGVNERVLLEPVDDESWRSGVLVREDESDLIVHVDGPRGGSEESFARTRVLRAPPPVPDELLASACVRVAYDGRWYFGQVLRLNRGRELITIKFDNGDLETVPAFDVFHADRMLCVVALSRPVGDR